MPVDENSYTRFYILTGGPGVGKTTLLEELGRKGFTCVPEIAREIIREQMKIDGNALPWKDRQLYIQLMLDRSLAGYKRVSKKDRLIFFDRSLIDTLCYARLVDAGISPEMDQYARQYRYNKKVFLLPPWKEIYRTDNERIQTWEEAVRTYETIAAVYQEYAYEITEVPRLNAGQRADFILENLAPMNPDIFGDRGN